MEDWKPILPSGTFDESGIGQLNMTDVAVEALRMPTASHRFNHTTNNELPCSTMTIRVLTLNSTAFGHLQSTSSTSNYQPISDVQICRGISLHEIAPTILLAFPLFEQNIAFISYY